MSNSLYYSYKNVIAYYSILLHMMVFFKFSWSQILSYHSWLVHTVDLLPSLKRKVFCVGDRLKMVKHKAWATTIVTPKLVVSMTTKGQMKPTCRVSLTASQAGEKSKSNVPEHTIVSSIIMNLIFSRDLRRRTAQLGPTIESAKQCEAAQHDQCVSKFKINTIPS